MKALSILPLLLLAAPALAQDQQMGARTKGMGGSYTAFEDDPVSIWLNPAGIATQPDQIAIVYQSYTAYTLKVSASGGTVGAEDTLVDPAVIPSYLGLVFQLGTPETPMAVGIAFVRPYHLEYSLTDLALSEAFVEESFARFRIAYALDLAFHDPGEPGWFTHLALGLGLDIGYETWELTELVDVPPSSTATFTFDDSANDTGYGVGFLLGLYDNTTNFKVNFGVAFHSRIKFEFNIDPLFFPAFDMPRQLNAGLTFFLFEGMPLRITVDAQWIDWEDTAIPSAFAPAVPNFEDVRNTSIGFEYRLELAETTFAYLRGGYRKFDAPWADETALPGTGRFILTIDTEDDKFSMTTVGFGLSWVSEDGKVHTLDIAADFGGDADNIAIGFGWEL